MAGAVIALLWIQNAALWTAIFMALWLRELQPLTPLILGITAATLGETAGLVYVVFHWLFTEFDYKG